jgi:ubiquinone/menaquinone biosynthesis C-methylase UbiE
VKNRDQFATFEPKEESALEAITTAQRIAFGPILFQAAIELRNRGILQFLAQKKEGANISEICEGCDCKEYVALVLLEAGLGGEICFYKAGKYFISKVGIFLNNDKMTRVNMDFTKDVCYNALSFLEESLDNGKPEGLHVLGPWQTIYQGLSILPEPAKTSWFEFDHFYSDQSFDNILPIVFADKPKRIFDIGGNTGKFSLKCCEHDETVEMTICDLPVQLANAEGFLSDSPFRDRIHLHAVNVLESEVQFPGKADAIMMSQFIDCFAPEEIVHILNEAKKALSPGGSIYIVETLWDRQKWAVSAFCLQQTSLYFSTIANGNSKMYSLEQVKACITSAGLEITEVKDHLGISSTLLKCSQK